MDIRGGLISPFYYFTNEVSGLKIGDRIKIIREWQGLSGGELADMSGCTQAAISQYENHKRTPTLKHFRGICKALKVPYSMLLEGIELTEDVIEVEQE
jgi:transcriptional regulator with XRE-family HTH domain